MYSYIYFYYKILIESNTNKDHRTDIVLIIFFYQLIHLLLIHEFLLKFFNISLLSNFLNHDYGTNKLIFIPILFVYKYLLSWYFNKRWKKIQSKYLDRIKINVKQTIIVLSIFIIPLICLIILFNS